MWVVVIEFESTPLYSDRYDGADLARGESGDNDISSSGGIFRLYFNVEGGVRADHDTRCKSYNRLLLFFILV